MSGDPANELFTHLATGRIFTRAFGRPSGENGSLGVVILRRKSREELGVRQAEGKYDLSGRGSEGSPPRKLACDFGL